MPEIIDPATGEPVPYGELGELIFTSLTKEALPVIRYRTGDITRLHHRDRAPAAAPLVRMDKISGRTDDMIIVRGVNVFPSQIETVLLQVQGVEPHYLIIVDRERGAMDTLEIWVEVSEGIFSDELGALADLQHARRARDRRDAGHLGSRQAGGAAPHRAQHGQGQAGHSTAAMCTSHEAGQARRKAARDAV